ncbi:helix-turn-helix domain-containing protein [Plebeiibacterium marinum]|uniref:Helix-turn-helix domain-containing protein n=1 Tax=Plebeiibacterium marinum TaxID=2992111 RepID=A0AAE3SN16_9BACT|nr:helix-turn-helix transcriptional regulator [Plebeiobacterium marinum]MCW3808149.1 helix-turn-helix domain-containing protein [Plebeiobacterium marinum]MCW3808150.1 helix-turn-helix domain-containing protein [Plebeiobacterium marinum]
MRGIKLLPKHKKVLSGLGENIKLARLRRKLTAEQVAERAGISRRTLVSIEQGAESVAIGSYVQVLVVLGLSDDIFLVGKDDTLGRKLQDADLINPKRNL